MTNEFFYSGVDAGNGGLKIASYDPANQNGPGFEKIEQSAVLRLSDNESGAKTRADVEDRDGARYVIGHRASKLSNEVTRSIDSSFIDTNEYAMMNLFALEQIGHGNHYMVAGLPVEWYEKDKDKLKSNIERRCWSRKVSVRGVAVVPQPLGTLTHISQDWQGNMIEDLSNKLVGIVDIGRGTVDLISAYDGELKEDSATGKAIGVHTIVQSLTGHLKKHRETKDVVFDDSELTEALRTRTVKLNSGEKDIGKMIDSVLSEYMLTLMAYLTKEWGNDLRKMDKLVITGGGANLIRALMEKEFSASKLIIPEQPEMANVYGFAKLAYALGQI